MSDSKPKTPAVDERIMAWVDEALDAEARAAFEAELEADPEFSREAKDYEAVVRALRRMPAQDAPDDFLKAVQSRIRRRTRGRFFSARVRYRFPYEAVINGILLLLLMGIYIIGMPSFELRPVAPTPDAIRAGSAPASIAMAILEPHGDVEIAARAPDGKSVVLKAFVPVARAAGLVAEIGLYPEMAVIGEVEPGPTDDIRVIRVRVPTGR